MPTWLAIVLGVFVLLVIVLSIRGMYARRRQLESSRGRFERHLARVNQDLAVARRRPRVEREELTLIQIVDPPGTEDDKAMFRVSGGGRDERLTLGRRGDDWVLEQLA
jgi:hypothetical protein